MEGALGAFNPTPHVQQLPGMAGPAVQMGGEVAR
jgi:hypothetical protein